MLMLKERFQDRKERRAWRKAESNIKSHAGIVALIIEDQVGQGDSFPINVGPEPKILTREEYMMKVGQRAVKNMVGKSFTSFEYDHAASVETTTLHNLEKARFTPEGEPIHENAIVVLNKVAPVDHETIS